MIVRYYENKELAYTSRKRYKTFNFVPFYEEEQRAVLLGDGASTTLKTNKENICDYVTIDETRWFVTSYTYMNGKQVQLNLQRDVIGEFGIRDCYGKIERGHTDTILKYRKELGLNQILKNRKKVIPDTNIYGNYSVDNHNNEMWGILYLVKPTELDPNTGVPYPEQVNINIPAFAPKTVNYDFIENGTTKNYAYVWNCHIYFEVQIGKSNNQYLIDVSFSGEKNNLQVSSSVKRVETNDARAFIITSMPNPSSLNNLSEVSRVNIASELGLLVGQDVLRKNSLPYKLPEPPELNAPNVDYNGVVIKKDNKFYSYSVSSSSISNYGELGTQDDILLMIFEAIATKTVNFLDENNQKQSFTVSFAHPGSYTDAISGVYTQIYRYTTRELSAFESGTIKIDVSQQLIDEPYSILAFPLFDVKISGSKEYIIDRKTAFMVFNTVIQFLSGKNAYLVDAQIYPYCPTLTSVSSEINGYPFFTINSTSYNHYCSVQLLPYSDIKKEYITRQYSVISPEQSGKFSFNFYDYVNKVEDNNGINYAKLNIIVKTALKPFGIISSAVIQSASDSPMGIPYDSDLRGSQPSSNGFECSLASNAFETYKRQNSNYQQIFALQKEELQKQHEVELTNDITSTIVNTMSATAMGAIAGANMADAGIFNSLGSKAAGAGIGASVAGVTVGAAMSAQTIMNNKLRDYEEYLQQANFDLQIGTIKNLPNSINRISSFNEIILQDFWYIIETYECSDFEKTVVDNFIAKYGYGIGVFDFVENYHKNGWFLRSTLVSSKYNVNLHMIAEKELMGGIYLYE